MVLMVCVCVCVMVCVVRGDEMLVDYILEMYNDDNDDVMMDVYELSELFEWFAARTSGVGVGVDLYVGYVYVSVGYVYVSVEEMLMNVLLVDVIMMYVGVD